MEEFYFLNIWERYKDENFQERDDTSTIQLCFPLFSFFSCLVFWENEGPFSFSCSSSYLVVQVQFVALFCLSLLREFLCDFYHCSCVLGFQRGELVDEMHCCSHNYIHSPRHPQNEIIIRKGGKRKENSISQRISCPLISYSYPSN